MTVCSEPFIDVSLRELFTGGDDSFESPDALLEALSLIYQFRVDNKNETNPPFNQDWKDGLPSTDSCTSIE